MRVIPVPEWGDGVLGGLWEVRCMLEDWDLKRSFIRLLPSPTAFLDLARTMVAVLSVCVGGRVCVCVSGGGMEG